MIAYIRRITQLRRSWFLLFGSAFFLEACAMVFQHVLGFQPCVMCIYQRTAVFGIMLAGLLGSIYPRSLILRWCALIIWGVASVKGLQLALKHTDLQLNPSPFNTCDLFVDFPGVLSSLPKAIPWFFQATGECSDTSWQFLSWTMPQWLIPIFAVYMVVCFIIISGNFIKGKCCGS